MNEISIVLQISALEVQLKNLNTETGESVKILQNLVKKMFVSIVERHSHVFVMMLFGIFINIFIRTGTRRLSPPENLAVHLQQNSLIQPECKPAV